MISTAFLLSELTIEIRMGHPWEERWSNPASMVKIAWFPFRIEEREMIINSKIDYFRKAAFCAVLALAACVATSANAQQTVPIASYTVNYNPRVRAVYIQNVNNPNGWACVAVGQASQSGSYKSGPSLLYGFTYSVRAMSAVDCRAGSALPNLYVPRFTVPLENQIFIDIRNSISINY
ncbi:hypothetical protein M0D46_05120 [Xanthomonas prunicola]|uniref:hypothetical protein n=1 Tax=Xanthomonas prunicola TaxID=2053930 RepID=UPI0021B3EE1C|nr:hypothetical protein [Xanthomonas prunicola]UXA70450.1 hypothetical protein M0D46_05120 [Xanthomonas prunicola]